MQKSDSMAPEYELDGHASSLIYAFKRGAKHLTDIFAYSKWTLPQKGSLLVDHVIISNCPSTPDLESEEWLRGLVDEVRGELESRPVQLRILVE